MVYHLSILSVRESSRALGETLTFGGQVFVERAPARARVRAPACTIALQRARWPAPLARTLARPSACACIRTGPNYAPGASASALSFHSVPQDSAARKNDFIMVVLSVLDVSC